MLLKQDTVKIKKFIWYSCSNANLKDNKLRHCRNIVWVAPKDDLFVNKTEYCVAFNPLLKLYVNFCRKFEHITDFNSLHSILNDVLPNFNT